MAKTLTISKRAKGFPIQLSRQHWFLIQSTYPWLMKMGAVTEGMTKAYTLIPEWEITAEDLKSAVANGYSRANQYGGGFYKSKTVRVRAQDVEGMIALLNLTAAYFAGGQLGSTLRTRAQRLESVSTLDKLADAGR